MDLNRFFCSWSGGKDSCLSLYRAKAKGWEPSMLFTMLEETGLMSRSHGLPASLIEKQAASMNIPLTMESASWKDYESRFLAAAHNFKDNGINAGVFGDIDLEDHKIWVERVCTASGIQAYLPLWNEKRKDIANEFIELGFKAYVTAVREDMPTLEWLGMRYDKEFIKEAEKYGVDPCGEGGEFHTVVVDGPIFSIPVRFEIKGRKYHGGYCFLDLYL